MSLPIWRALLLWMPLSCAASSLPPLAFTTQVEASTPEFQARKEFVSTLCARLQRQCNLEYFPSLRAEAMLKIGRSDAEVGRAAVFESIVPNALRVPTKIYDVGFIALAKKGNRAAAKIRSWDDLRPLRVTYIRGYNFIARHTEISQLHPVDNYNSCIGMVLAQRADVCLVTKAKAAQVLGAAGLKTADFVFNDVVREPLYLYLAKHQGALLQQVDVQMQQMHKDGSIRRIFKLGQ